MDFANAMKDPGRSFESPEALEAAAGFSPAQKQAILRQWKDQLEQLLVATDENMPGPETSTGVNADCLRRVVSALGRIAPQAR